MNQPEPSESRPFDFEQKDRLVQLALAKAISKRVVPLEARIAIANLLEEAVKNQYPPQNPNPASDSKATEMNEQGFTQLGALLSAQQVAEVVAHFKGRECCNQHAEEHPAQDKRYASFERASEQFRFGSYRMQDICEAPHLLELFLRPELLDIVESFLGGRPMIYSLNTFWSFPREEPPARNYGQEFHRDLPMSKFCVLFLYLTDATETSGTHQYFVKTHSLEAVRDFLHQKGSVFDPKLFFELPQDGAGYTALYMSELQELLVSIVGKAGDGFMAFPYGLHRGLAPTESPRLLAWARYGLFATPAEVRQVPAAVLKDRIPDDERSWYVLRPLIKANSPSP